MPSDERIRGALKALDDARESFRSAVACGVDEVRGMLDRMDVNGRGAGVRQGVELGAFAAGRIDVDRFGALFAHGAVLDAAGAATVKRALDILEEIAGWSEDDFAVRVAPGHDLRGEVAAALAVAGRAFGAARAIEMIRTRRYNAADHATLLGPFPPERWNRAERQISPPLVVEVDGGDLRVCGLAEFLDGSQKLVLIVRGEAPPASLVRLITPGVLVAQVSDVESLPSLLSFDGPAIVAIVPPQAALFVHDPRGGDALGERLTVTHVPDGEIRGVLGSLSAFQRREDLGWLGALVLAGAAGASGSAAASARSDFADPVVSMAVTSSATTHNDASRENADGVAKDDPAGRLAALLLRQADLSGL